MLEWLTLGRVDCALVYNATASTTVDLQPLTVERLYLIAPLEAAEVPVTPRRRAGAGGSNGGSTPGVTLPQLADYPLIIPSRPHAMRMSVENALATVDRKIRVAHEIECIPAVIDLVRQGHGFGVLPVTSVRSTPWSQAVRVQPIGDPPLGVSLAIATSAQRPRSPLMRKAVDLIRDIVRRAIDPPGRLEDP
jgi:LysR family nitrogen assimilation transcriptional regulator